MKYTDLSSSERILISKALDIDSIKLADCIDQETCLVFTEDEVISFILNFVRHFAWSLKATFILEVCKLDPSGEEAIEIQQRAQFENSNAYIVSLIEKTVGIEYFAKALIAEEGRGKIISTYDGEEIKIHFAGRDIFIYKMQ